MEGDPEGYLRQVEIYTGKWNEKQLMGAIRTSLAKRALAWFRAFKGSIIKSSNDFIVLFRKKISGEEEKFFRLNFIDSCRKEKEKKTERCLVASLQS
ncbi:hypothetical protein PAEPH01_2292 [Pancytospora epiphaga]|nr:hypothetical protein PAEPH01_2292 [Pancytospora epiphaga]